MTGINRRLKDLATFLATQNKILDLLANPKFYLLVVFVIFLAFIYRAWPWRESFYEYSGLSEPIWLYSWTFGLYRFALFEFNYHLIGSLFLIPAILGAVLFGGRGALIVWLISVVASLPLVMHVWDASNEALVLNIVFLMLMFLTISILAFEIQRRAKVKKIAEDREDDRRTYILRILEAQENERRRIAQELHDDTIQSLLLVLSHAEAILSSDDLEKGKIRGDTSLIKEVTISTIENLRRISLDLRPSILDNLGLMPALRWLVSNMNDESVNCKMNIVGVERKLPVRIESNVFRIVQEALNNIKRHSRASNVSIKTEFKENLLTVKIKDNGQGFTVPDDLDSVNKGAGLGLVGMRQRIQSLGGHLQIQSRVGKGTLLQFEISY